MTSNLTVKNVLRTAELRLKTVGIDTSRLDARVLLGHAMGIEASHLLMHQDTIVEDTTTFEAMLRRRETREPVAHIVGVRGFWDHDFAVTADVLTPRPDSETLIETALEILPQDQPARILDLGTGSGCLILSILAARPKATGVALDLSAAALTVARSNAKSLSVTQQVKFIEGDFSTAPTELFDLIISNPPYIRTADISALEPELHHEPVLALDGGDDGLTAYRQLANLVIERTGTCGTVIFEVGIDQAPPVSDLLRSVGYAGVSVRCDLSGVQRCVIATQTVTHT